jgi:hypothetical protein
MRPAVDFRVEREAEANKIGQLVGWGIRVGLERAVDRVLDPTTMSTMSIGATSSISAWMPIRALLFVIG